MIGPRRARRVSDEGTPKGSGLVVVAGRGARGRRAVRAASGRSVLVPRAYETTTLAPSQARVPLRGELHLPVPHVGRRYVQPGQGHARGQGRVLARCLCGNQIFNPTSMCAYATISTRDLPPCFENSTRAIDSSKNQPKRLRFDRAREFQSLVGTSRTSG